MARGLALLLVLSSASGALGWLWWNCARSGDVSFLPRLAPAEWIVYPAAPEGDIATRLELETVFRRAFVLDKAPAQAVVRVAGFHHCSLSLNGVSMGAPVRQGRNWKQPDVWDVARQLRAGENRITVTVFNSNGPPALWLALEAGGFTLTTDEAWEASLAGAVWRNARFAARPKLVPVGSPVSGGVQPWAACKARWPALLVFAALSAVAGWFIGRWWRAGDRQLPGGSNWRREILPVLGLAGVWVALFANNLGVLPNQAGFDADGHMAYIRHLQEHHSLPRADEGWEMFQPPLYYICAATLLDLFSLTVSDPGGIMALRILGLGIGVAHFLLVWACLRLLFPHRRSQAGWGVVLAAGLPPLLYLSHYVTNEGLAAALTSACVYLSLLILRRERASWRLCAGLGLCLGAALLAKSTSLLMLPVIAVAWLWKGLEKRETSLGCWAGRLGLVVAVCAMVCGWFYLGVWRQFGTPLIHNSDPGLPFQYWQDDGYRTSACYLRFGEALVHPWFSGFNGFADGIYSTLWGDGLLGGYADLYAPPPWDYDFMAIGYWLALLPTLAILAGGIVALVNFIRRPSADWCLLLGLAFLTALAMVLWSLKVPSFSIKAFYGLSALVPLCAFGALGMDLLSRCNSKLRVVLGIGFGVWAINGFASFWILRSSVQVSIDRARSLFNEGRYPGAIGVLEAQLQREPRSTAARFRLVSCLIAAGDGAKAAEQAEILIHDHPADAAGHLAMVNVCTRRQQIAEAIEHARRAVELAPGDGHVHQQLVMLLVRQQRFDEAIRAAREGLGVAPFNPMLRFALGLGLLVNGQDDEADSQLRLAFLLHPGWPEAHCELAAALNIRHRAGLAIAHYREALRLNPNLPDALNNLARILATHPEAQFRNGAEAVQLAEHACELTAYQQTAFVSTLAAAYAESGRFEKAVATAQKACALASAMGQTNLLGRNQELLRLYENRQPCREPN